MKPGWYKPIVQEMHDKRLIRCTEPGKSTRKLWVAVKPIPPNSRMMPLYTQKDWRRTPYMAAHDWLQMHTGEGSFQKGYMVAKLRGLL